MWRNIGRWCGISTTARRQRFLVAGQPIGLPVNSENRYHPTPFGVHSGQSWLRSITGAVSDPRVGAINGGILVFSLWTQQNEKVDWQYFSRKIQSFRQPKTGH